MKIWDDWIRYCKETYGAPPKVIKADIPHPIALVPKEPPKKSKRKAAKATKHEKGKRK